jgi:ion channel-forming bestrophin family protein
MVKPVYKIRSTIIDYLLANMTHKHNRTWFRKAFNLKNSVLPKLFVRLTIVTLLSVIITVLFYRGFSVSIPILSAIVPNIILGLLLVFRTNTAYERFWEGRKLWGDINNNTRAIALQINALDIDHSEKVQLSQRLIRFAFLTKDKLRNEINSSDLAVTQKKATSPNIWELNQLNKELVGYMKKGLFGEVIYETFVTKISHLIHAVGGCERIIATPIPLGYSIHIKQLILLYCATLPFQFVAQSGIYTPLICFFISFALMGIEQIGLEIEDPFGTDRYDIQLDTICTGIQKNIMDVIDSD